MNNVKYCWREYNKSLVQRGSISLWIDEELLKNDQVFEPTKGRSKFKKAILQAGWLLKTIYRLTTFRSLEGYLNSLIEISCLLQSRRTAWLLSLQVQSFKTIEM